MEKGFVPITAESCLGIKFASPPGACYNEGNESAR